MMQVARRTRTTLARLRPLQRSIVTHIDVPGLRRRQKVHGSVWAVTMVRNEADIISHSVRHLLRQGVHGVIVVDNLSTDKSRSILDGLADEDRRVYVGTDSLDAYHQGRKMSHLAHLARRAGAEWVVLFDADEFWFSPEGTVSDLLRSQPDEVSVVRCRMFDGHATDLGGMQLGDPGLVLRIDDEPSMTKVAIRPDGYVWVNMGNHEAVDLPGRRADGLVGLHLPRRSLQQFTRKVTQGAASIHKATGLPEHFGSHWRESAELGERQRVQAWRDEVAGTFGHLAQNPLAWTSWGQKKDQPNLGDWDR